MVENSFSLNLKEKVLKLQKIFDTNNNFAIFMHENPDGDTIGAGLALGNYLETLGKKVGYFCPSNIPSKFDFLNAIKKIKNEFDFFESRQILIFVDTGSPVNQLSKFWSANESYFKRKFKVVIDHHIENDGVGDLIIRDKVSSTCFLMGKIFDFMKVDLNVDLADLLLLGHLTDTNFCMWESSGYEDIDYASFLVKKGADKGKIVNNIYYNMNFGSLKLIGKVLERVQLVNGIVWSYYSDDELKEFDAQREDVDFVIDLLRKVKEGIIYLLFKKQGDIVKVSVRSRIPIAAKIARYFGGGGHYYASGFKIKITESLESLFDDVVKKIENLVINDLEINSNY